MNSRDKLHSKQSIKDLAGKSMREENAMDGYSKIEQYNPEIIKSIAGKYRDILRDVGEDPDR